MIPNHLHFVFFSPPTTGDAGRAWGLVDHVCVASAIAKIRPSSVSFYLDAEPGGPWWALTRPLVDLVPTVAPDEVFGNPVRHMAHKADVVRLQKLIAHGGIYLDTDMLVHRSFDPLLDHHVVMGREGPTALCNAAILGERDAPFLRDWYDRYRSFDGSQWNRHSVILPAELARDRPADICRLPETAFFRPDWQATGIYRMFGARNRRDVRGDYANHLWGQRAKDYIRDLTPGHVRRIDSAFHSWVRPYLDGLPDDFGGGIDTRFGLPRHVYADARTAIRIAREAIAKRTGG